MLPGAQTFRTIPIQAALTGSRASPEVSLVYDLVEGGYDLNDASLGLMYQTWTAEIGVDGIYLTSATHPTKRIIYGTDITEVSLAFNRNMDWICAYTQYGESKLIWFNPDVSVNHREVINLPDAINPRLIHDDPRAGMSDHADVMLFYIRNGMIYQRRQRDAFAIEMALDPKDFGSAAVTKVFRLHKVCRGVDNRLHFICQSYVPNDFTFIKADKNHLRIALEKLTNLDASKYSYDSINDAQTVVYNESQILNDNSVTIDLVLQGTSMAETVYSLVTDEASDYELILNGGGND